MPDLTPVDESSLVQVKNAMVYEVEVLGWLRTFG
jgi:hypothetical protein